MRNLKKPLLATGLLIVAALTITLIYIAVAQQGENSFFTHQRDHECALFNDEEYCTDVYLGLSETTAIQKAQDNLFTAKIKERDGDTEITNTDIGGRPVFFTVENGVVVKAEFK